MKHATTPGSKIPTPNGGEATVPTFGFAMAEEGEVTVGFETAPAVAAVVVPPGVWVACEQAAVPSR